jgi:hypothetical protein
VSYVRAVDEDKLEAFVGQVITELGAIAAAPLVVLGDKLGLYRAMVDGDPVTAADLAARTGTAERYVREWLAAQAAGGYVTLDAQDGDDPPRTWGPPSGPRPARPGSASSPRKRASPGSGVPPRRP